MRKYMREILRRRGERKGLKPSRFVAQRLRNRAHGTKPKRLWRHRAV